MAVNDTMKRHPHGGLEAYGASVAVAIGAVQLAGVPVVWAIALILCVMALVVYLWGLD